MGSVCRGGVLCQAKVICDLFVGVMMHRFQYLRHGWEYLCGHDFREAIL